MGINAPKFAEELSSKRGEKARDQIRTNFAGRRIVLSVERLDYTKGIPNRLEAIDHFLSTYSDRDRIVFIFVSVPSRESVPEYQHLREEVQRQVGEINGRYATMVNSPIHFIYNPVKFEELAALYSVADVCLVTPLMDGMNLVAKEYVACQDENPGVLILSEFAGAAQELFNAISVNPYDIRQVASALEHALAMSEEERRERMTQMRSRITLFDAQYWAKSFCDDLMSHDYRASSLEMSTDTEEAILERFRKADRIGCFLDYDGSLREFESEPHRAFPDAEILELLERLQGVSFVDTYIISGRNKHQLDAWFAQFNVTLVAEHGYTFRRVGSTTWELLNESADFSWKPRVMEILRDYEGETPGSFIEEKRSALVWHYRKSDPEFGSWKAHALAGELYEMLANLPVEMHHGKKIVEVSSIYVNKGAAMERFMHEGKYDLGFCAGDDQTDETMFRLERDDLLSVKIGEGASQAKYRVRDPRRFRALLNRILDMLEDET
ncbi:MAG: trehalose-phosphatase [Candidatus Hydrogenedentota bacterium]